jgi:hypothetical protein
MLFLLVNTVFTILFFLRNGRQCPRSEPVSEETPKKPPNFRKARYTISSPWLSFFMAWRLGK